MANINVSYEEMKTAAGQLNSGKDDITSKLESLKGYISTLVSSGFITDRASKAFEETYDQYDRGAKDVIASLEDLAKYLTSAADEMQATDERLAAPLG
ncbi:MAG: WXG100 family type VII secretion target [Propionibacteriaceae bacterium]|jgi:WXG100 family type VII secretion target|nr:WXG100 family type VII secretion target [Propionibacteriaceae bacterium]